MKKITLMIVIIMLCALTFSGCSSTPTMTNELNSLEIITYDVYHLDENGSHGTTPDGTMVMTLTSRFHQNVTAGAYSKQDFSGYELNYALTMTNGDSLNSTCYFSDTSFKPQLSTKTVTTSGVTTTTSAKFEDAKYYYTSNGEEQVIKLKKNGTYYDNEYLYVLLRLYPLTQSGTFKGTFSMSYSIPSPSQNEIESVSAAASSSDTTLTIGGVDYTTRLVAIGLNTKLSGTANQAYFNTSAMDFYNESRQTTYQLTYVPMRIIENDIQYEFKEITSARSL